MTKFSKPAWQPQAEARLRRLEAEAGGLLAIADAIYQGEIVSPSLAQQKLETRRKELAAHTIPSMRTEYTNPQAIKAQIDEMASGIDAEIESYAAQIAEAKTRHGEALAKAKAAQKLLDRAKFAYQRATDNAPTFGTSVY